MVKKLFKIALANGLIGLYRWCTGRPRPAAELSATGDFRSIAIYSTTALGDLMFNTPAVHQLRRRYPSAHLTLIVHQKYVDLVRDYADIDEVLCWDGRFARFVGFVRQLRAVRPDLAVILHSRAPFDIMTAVFAGACHILRDERVLDGKVPMAQWLSAWSKPGFSGHVIHRKLAMLSVLGCHADDVDMRVPCPVDRARFAVAGKVRIGFQLGASKPERVWPIERFVALAEALLPARPACHIVLMGMPSEQPLAEAFLASLPAHWRERVTSMVGRTTVQQAFELVASLDLLVTGDTGPLHLAIAQHVPTISLFVTADPGETGPYQDPAIHTVIHRPLPAEASAALRASPMANIPIDIVLSAVLRQLSSNVP